MSVGVDWLAFTVRGWTVHQLKSSLLDYLPGEFEDLPHGGMGYQRLSVGPGGARIYSSRGRDDVHISLSGKACGSLGGDELRELLDWATTEGKVKRIDVYADDHERRTMPRAVYDAADDAVTHTNREGWQIIESRHGGATCYIGAKSSRQMLRMYDKAAESRGKNNSIRWEQQSLNEVAHQIACRLIREEWGTVWAENVVRLVDFRSRVTGRGDRGERSAWFAELVGAAQKAVIAVARPIRTVDDVIEWLRRQVGPSLAVGFEYSGGDLEFLTGLVDEGRQRWRPRPGATGHCVHRWRIDPPKGRMSSGICLRCGDEARFYNGELWYPSALRRMTPARHGKSPRRR